jgi:hypothetical protein
MANAQFMDGVMDVADFMAQLLDRTDFLGPYVCHSHMNGEMHHGAHTGENVLLRAKHLNARL